MIYRDNKFIIAKTIGPNVNIDGIVEEINKGRMRLKVDPAMIDAAVMQAAMAKLEEINMLNIKQKESDTEDGTGEETEVQA